MRAVVMRGLRKPLTIEDVDPPRIGPEEVLVETQTCGICGTDLHILDGYGYVPSLPHILGHEPAGVVAEVGSKVKHLKAGDRVVPHLFFSCDRCYYCRVGRHQQCVQLNGLLGVLSPGAFAEYFKAPVQNLVSLPESVPFDVGGLVADAVVTALHAVKRANLHVNETAVVVGSGGVGQGIIQILRAAGVRVLAFDRSKEKLSIAQEMGATLALRSGDPKALERVRKVAGNEGAQCVFDCVGTAQTTREAAEYVMRGGRIVVIGETPDYASISTTEIAQKELEIIGSRNGTRQDIVEAIRLIDAGIVRPRISDRFRLEDINAAIECMRRGPLGRVVVIVKG